LANGGVIHACDIPGWNQLDIKFNTQVDICYYNGPAKFTQALCHETTEVLFCPYMHKQSMLDPYRVRFAVEEIKKLWDVGHDIYVFAEERVMLDQLATHLDESTYGKFIGGLKDCDMLGVTSKRILLTTYGYASTGVSIEKQTAIVFLTPRRANMKQILARVLRRSGDLSVERRIIDIVDNRTPLRGQVQDRILAYKHYNMRIVNRTISYKDYHIHQTDMSAQLL
jgi:hypothetical protein